MNKVKSCVNLGNKSKWNVPGHVSRAGGGWAQWTAYQAPPLTPAAQPPHDLRWNISEKVKVITWLIGPHSVPRFSIHSDPLTPLHFPDHVEKSRQVVAWWIVRSTWYR